MTFNKSKYIIAITGVSILAVLYVLNTKKPTYSDFVAHNKLNIAIKYPNNNRISKTQTAFNTKNYEEALEHLTVLSNIYLNDVEIKLYRGICLLELDNYFEAEAIFDKISTGNNNFNDEAIWYKGLSLLKQKKYLQTKKILKQISITSSYYTLAQKLLKKL